MDLRFSKIILLFLVLCCHASAKDNIDNFIKQQNSSDYNAYKEQKVQRQNVYSNTESKVFRLGDLPEEENCFVINNLILKNDFLKGSADRAIKNEILGRCVGNASVVKIATALQDFYINAGYITTRITLPSQNISTGILTLNVEAGKIYEIIIEDKDVNTWMLPFKKEDLLNIRDIEQGLENLQQVPNVNVNISIEPGTRHGYSNIRIATHREKNWNIRAGYSNWGNKDTGRYLTSIVGYLYNMTNFSDLVYLAGTRSTTGNYENVSAYYSLPVGYWNYSLLYSGSTSRQAIPLNYASLDYVGKSDYWSAKVSRTVYRNKSRIISGSLEFIRRKSAYKINGQELVLQKRDMDNVKVGINYKQQFDNAYWDSSLSWQRFLRLFGAEKTPDMVYGDVSSVSQIFSLDSTYSRALGGNIYSANFFAQYAPRELTLQDQMTLGERWNVRGFENSVGLNSKSGYYLQNTLYRPVGFFDANYYGGIDIGQVKQDSTYGDKILIGAALGIQGNIKSLMWDTSLSVPVKYPDNFSVDKINLNFNLAYRL